MDKNRVEIIKKIQAAIKEDDVERLITLFRQYDDALHWNLPFGWLHDAAIQNSLNALKYFIDLGFDVNALNSLELKTTPLADAAGKGYYEVVKMLCENGAIFDTSSRVLYENGTIYDASNRMLNPLFRAIYGKHSAVAKYLIDMGIDITPKYEVWDKNVDAYEYAKLYGCTDIMEYIKQQRGYEESIEEDVNKSNLMEEEIDIEGLSLFQVFKLAIQKCIEEIMDKTKEETLYIISFVFEPRVNYNPWSCWLCANVEESKGLTKTKAKYEYYRYCEDEWKYCCFQRGMNLISEALEKEYGNIEFEVGFEYEIMKIVKDVYLDLREDGFLKKYVDNDILLTFYGHGGILTRQQMTDLFMEVNKGIEEADKYISNLDCFF